MADVVGVDTYLQEQMGAEEALREMLERAREWGFTGWGEVTFD